MYKGLEMQSSSTAKRGVQLKDLLFLVFILFVFGCGRAPVETNSNPSNTSIRSDRGDQIVAEYLKRDAAAFRKMRVRFTVRTPDEPDKIYEIDNWRKQTPDSTTTLTQIIKPAEESDLGSLTFEHKGQKTVVVTYAPSRGDFRETDTHKMFFGGLTAGELLGEWEDFDFRFAEEKEIDGKKVFVVDGKLRPGKSSVASRMNIAFRADSYVPLEFRLFDSNDREIRFYKTVEFKDEPGHPYAAKTEVDNPIYKAMITIEIVSREFPATLDESMFVRDKLKSFVRK